MPETNPLAAEIDKGKTIVLSSGCQRTADSTRMMICPDCGNKNSEGARFCSHCAASLSLSRIGTDVDSRTASGRAVPGNEHHDDFIGRTIEGRYRIDGLIGLGGMGSVYRVTRLLIGDEVAVKILNSEQRDATAWERFRREARAAARLKHPNAVNIYDFGVTDDGLQYLVMELVEGESLRRMIKQGPLTLSASVEIINQVCAALDEAHRQNIIHRDIKPDNIIVNVTAPGLRVKVLDLGIAKLRDDVAGSLTQTGSLLGTPHYMSPEQCLGEELDGRADIYSVGVVLYEMLTGTVPFNSPTPAAVSTQIDSLRCLARWLTIDWRIPPSAIKGHKDYASTACPGRNLEDELPGLQKMLTEPPVRWR